MAKRDLPKTVFGTPWGLYAFICMPFGLHGLATTFQHLMDQILALHAEYATAYIDDIVVFSQTWTQHKRALGTILSELQKTDQSKSTKMCSGPETNQITGVFGQKRYNQAMSRQSGDDLELYNTPE